MRRYLLSFFICLIAACTPPDHKGFMSGMGALVGHGTMKLGELEVCKDRFPENAELYTKAWNHYRALISADLDAGKRAADKLVPHFYEMAWRSGLSSGTKIVMEVYEKTEKLRPGYIGENCQIMLEDVKDGVFRRKAELLRPLSEASPDAWRRVQSYLGN